jgi:hypothetical protein
MGERSGTCVQVSVGKPEEKETLEVSGVEVKIITKEILEKWNWHMDCIDVAQVRDRWAGCCVCGNESLGLIKCGKCLE